MNANARKFNIAEKEYPKVLLFGNGLTRNEKSLSWDTLIEKVCRPGVNIEYYKTDIGNNKKVFRLPYSVLSLATSPFDDKERHNKYAEVLGTIEYGNNTYLKTLVKDLFDAVLTTNYTYEAEVSIETKYANYNSKQKQYYAYYTSDRYDSKYLIHSYNKIGKDNPGIWHIHGEVRRKDSMILSLYEYVRYINKIGEYKESRREDYLYKTEELEFESWIDYFLFGEVFVLGFGFDFSELDLWWLLGRRLSTNENRGQIHFYEPETNDNKIKHIALKDMGVDVQNLGFIEEKNKVNYDEFYKKAIEKIFKQVKR